MRLRITIFVFLTTLAYACSKESKQAPATPSNPVTNPPAQTWSFEPAPIWKDEFDTNGKPDATKWGYDVGGNGWGNQELQYYSNGDNVAIENGLLKIEARRETVGSNQYTSTRLVTRNKADWLYGRFEIRAKLPRGRGTWPAIWMLPTENTYGTWPRSGEMDIMEHVGYDLNRVHFTIHTEAFNHSIGTQKGGNKFISTATDSFHVYRMDWTPYGLRGYFDDEKVFEFMNQGSGYRAWPFDKKFHLIFNIAVGGSWGGAQGVDPAAFPVNLEVDYVRVYKFLQ